MKAHRALGLALLMVGALAVHAAAELDTARIAQSVVRITVSGRWASTDREIEKVGTGFFVPSAGFVLSAGHVFDAKQNATDGEVSWKEPPAVTIEYMDDGVMKALGPSQTCLLYVDQQTDLALIGTTLHRDGLELGNGLHLEKMQPITVVAFGIPDRQDPVFVPGHVDSPVSFSHSHGGRVDINVSGLFESDSGSPVLDEYGQVVGIFSKGRKYSGIGEVAVPISFAAPLLSMAGIAYPPPQSIREWLTQSEGETVSEVEEALRELKAEIVRYEFRFPQRAASRDLHVTYIKRLAAGYDPSSIEFVVRVRKGDRAFDKTVVANVDPRASGEPKQGLVTIPSFSDKLADYLSQREQAGQESFSYDEIREIQITPIAKYDFLDGQMLEGRSQTFPWPPGRQ